MLKAVPECITNPIQNPKIGDVAPRQSPGRFSLERGAMAPPFSCKGRASLLAKFVSYCLTLFDPSSIYFMSQQIPAMVLA